MDKSVNDQFITGLAMVVFLEALGFKMVGGDVVTINNA